MNGKLFLFALLSAAACSPAYRPRCGTLPHMLINRPCFTPFETTPPQAYQRQISAGELGCRNVGASVVCKIGGEEAVVTFLDGKRSIMTFSSGKRYACMAAYEGQSPLDWPCTSF